MAVYKISANGKEGRIDSAAFEKEYDILLKKYPDLKVRVLRGDQSGYIPATNYHKALEAGFKPYVEPDKPEASVQPAAQDTPSRIQPGAPKQQPIDLSAPAQAPAMIKTDPNLPSSPEQQLEAAMTKQGEELLQQDEEARQALKEQAGKAATRTEERNQQAKQQLKSVSQDILDTNQFAYTPIGGSPMQSKVAVASPEQQQAYREAEQESIITDAAKRKAEAAQSVITEIERENKNFFIAAGRGIGQTVSDIDNWDMGATDYRVNKVIQNTADKFAQDPESLTEAERDLLEAIALEVAVSGEFGDELTRGYKAGQVTGEAMPFMAEILINPLSGTGRAASKWAIKKFGKEGFLALVKRYGTRVAADVAGAAGIAATTGAGGVAADTQARMTGQAQFQIDDNGYVVYTGHAGGEELPSALAKAYGARTIEYFSEMSGEYFAKLSPLTRKITPKRVANMLDNIKTSDWAKVVDDFATKTQWQGTINEWAEEQVGTVLNAMFVGDQEISDLWDVDQQIDTFLGVALMGGAFSIAKTAGYRTPKHRAEKELKKAGEAGRKAFGDQNWEDIQAEIDNASEEQLHAIVKQAVNAAKQAKTPQQQDENNPINLDDPINNATRENQIAAGMIIANYVAKLQQQRGANIADMKRKTEGEVTPEQLQLENSFYEGVNRRISIRKAKKELEEAAKEIDPGLDEVIQDPAFITSIPEREDAEQVLRYANAKARYDGLMQAYSDDIEDQVQSATQQIKSRTDKTGNLTLVETITGEQVHILSGNIAFDQAGLVDKAHSEDKPVIAVDQEGNKKMLSIREISKLLDQTNAQEAAAAVAEEIRNTVAAQAEQEAETPEPEEIQQAVEGVNVQDVVQLNLNEKPTSATIQSIDPATGEILLQLEEPILNEQGKEQKVISMPADQFTKALIRNDKPGDEPPAVPPAAAGQLVQTESTGQPTVEAETQAQAQAQAPVKEFPKDKEGYVDYSQITEPQDFIDALMTEFSPEDAAAVVDDYIAEAEKAIKAAEKEKDPVKKRRKVAAERDNAEKYIQMRDILKKRREAEQAERLKADIEKRNQAKEQAKAEAAAKATQQPTEQTEPEQQEDIANVPDISLDSVKDARARGFRKVDGVKVERKPKAEVKLGAKTVIKFALNDEQEGAYVLTELDEVQPSHINDRKNPLHFLNDAQPKKREKKQDSKLAAGQIAKNFNPVQATENVVAYHGAPIINARKEVIQGNGRTSALHELYKNYQDNAEAYKQYLIDNAQRFGIDPEEVRRMKKPALVRLVDVEDERAIQLGNYGPEDIESGVDRKMNITNVVNVLGEKITSFVKILYHLPERIDEENRDKITIRELAKRNGENALKYLFGQEAIGPGVYESAFSDTGGIKPEFIDALMDLSMQLVFKNGIDNLKTIFEDIVPSRAQMAIIQTIHRESGVLEGNSFLEDIQEAIEVCYYLSKDPNLKKTRGNIDQAIKTALLFSRQSSIDLDGNEGVFIVGDKYSKLSIVLAAHFYGLEQKGLKQKLDRLYDDLSGQKDIFAQGEPALSKSEVIKKHFNVEYNERRKNESVPPVDNSRSLEGGRAGHEGDVGNGSGSQRAGRADISTTTGATPKGEPGQSGQGEHKQGAENIESRQDAEPVDIMAEAEQAGKEEDSPGISEDKERLNRMLAEGLGSREKRDEEGKFTKTSVITGDGSFDTDTGVKYPFLLYNYYEHDNGHVSLMRYGNYLTLDDAKAMLEHKDGPIPVRSYHGQKYNGIAESTFRIALSKGELDKQYDWEWIEYPRVKGKGYAVGRLKPLESKDQSEASQQEQESPAQDPVKSELQPENASPELQNKSTSETENDKKLPEKESDNVDIQNNDQNEEGQKLTKNETEAENKESEVVKKENKDGNLQPDVSLISDEDLNKEVQGFEDIIKEREGYILKSNMPLTGSNSGIGTLTESELDRFTALTAEQQRRSPSNISAEEAKKKVAEKRKARLEEKDKAKEDPKKDTDNAGTFDAENNDIRFRKTDAAGFYSTVEAALEAIPQDKGTPGQMKAMLLKNGAKQAELDGMDYDGTFTGKSVTKTEIQDWIDQNRIEVEEVEKGISKVEVKSIEPVSEKYATVFTVTFSDNSTVEVDLSGKYDNDPSDISEREIAEEAQKLRAEDDLTYEGDEEIKPTKYSQYQEPGGENYREVLLTMPDKSPKLFTTKVIGNKWFVIDSDGKIASEPLTAKFEAEEIAKRRTEIESGKKINNFKSSHFDEPNIIAHIRFNERTMPNGEKVLFIEEIQSDWAQKGKKEGFANTKAEKRKKELLAKDELSASELDELGRLNEELGYKAPVADMPFKQTGQWVNLALRRMMRYAAENGFDRIAWTNGEQQADRYDLSKQVDDIWTSVYSDSWTGKQYEKLKDVEVTLNNGEVKKLTVNESGKVVSGDFEGESLDNVVGKEMAEKIIGAQEDTNFGEQDLKVGGEGMKAFYDKIVPSAASKLGKPFGAKVEQIELPVEAKEAYDKSHDRLELSYEAQEIQDRYIDSMQDEESDYTLEQYVADMKDAGYEVLFDENGEPENLKKITKGQAFTVQSIPVTDKMYESVMQGVPLYKMTEELRRKIGVVSQAKLAVLRSFFDNVSKEAVNAVDIVVVDSRDELSQELQDKMPDDTDVQGFYYTKDNKAYFILNEIQRPELAFRTWVHEVGVHAGLRSIIPARDFSRLMRKIYNDLGQDEIRRVIPKVYWNEDIETQAEEYLAFIGEKIIKQEDLSKKEQSIWNKIVDLFHEVLNKLYKNGRFTKQDAESLVMASVQNSFRGSNGKLASNMLSGQSGQTGVLQRNDRTPATTDSGTGEGTIFAAAREALKKYERNKETAAQLQINWEAESGNVPARRDKAIASSAATSVLQRKAGYDPDISTGVSYVERLISNRGHVTFMGDMLTGPAKIKSAGDIAFIFKNLESAATENTFFVFMNDKGEYRVLYVGTGSSSGAVVDVSQIAPAAKEFGANRVCMVHNHPSGNLIPSSADVGLHRRISAISDKLGVTVMPSIIINTDSGEYAQFDQDYPMKAERPTERKAKPVDVYQFDRQKLYKATKERKKIRSSRDVAEFLSQQKRGAVDKLHLIIADRQNVISRYLLVDGKIKTDDLISLILDEAGRHGEAVFIATNGRLDDAKYIRESVRAADINLLDVLEIKQNDDIVNNYRSLADQQVLEPEGVYGSDKVLFRKSDKEEVPETQKAQDVYEQALEKTTINILGHKWTDINRNYLFKEGYQDSMLSLKIAQEAIAKETDSPIQDFEDAYTAENHLSSKGAAETEFYNKNYLAPLFDAVKAITDKGAEYEDVKAYVMAKHGLERNRLFAWRDALKSLQGVMEPGDIEKIIAEHDERVAHFKEAQRQGGLSRQEVIDKTERLREGLVNGYKMFRKDDYSGLTDLTDSKKDFEEKAEAMVEAFEKKYPEETADLWDSINAATKRTLQKQFEGGLLTREMHEYIRGMFEYYVPLRGFDEDTASDMYEYYFTNESSFNAPIKKAEGRKSLAEDPFANIGNMAQSGILQANRNLMKQKLLNLALNHPTSLLTVREVWYKNEGTKEKPKWVKSFPEFPENATPEQAQQAIQEHDKLMRELEAKEMAQHKRTKVKLDYKASKRQISEHIVMVKSAGKEYAIYVNGNPRMAQAVNGLTNPDTGKIYSAIGQLNRQLAANFTTRNPAFVFSNMSRDIIFASTAVGIKEDAAYRKQFRGTLGEVMLKIGSLMKKFKKGTLDMNIPLEKAFSDFMSNGGETGYTALYNLDKYKSMMQKHIRKAKGVTLNPIDAGRAIVDGIGFMNRCAEDISRFAVYYTSRKQGRSLQRSIKDAKEITVNFNKKGSGAMGARHLRTYYLFFNAAVQSLDNFSKLAKKDPKRFSVAIGSYIAAGVAVPVITSFLLSLFGDDDDKEAYNNLPNWIRRNNLCIYSGNGKFVTIPLPIEMRAFYGLGELFTQWAAGHMKYDNVGLEMANQILDLLPLNPIGAEGDIVSSVTPDFAKPVIQVSRNKDFFGKPIYKKNDFNELMPAFTKAYAGTNKQLVKSAELLNEAFGGDKYTKKMDVNPAAVEHIFEGYFGGMGKTINQLGKTIGMAWNKDDRQWRNVPVINRFFSDTKDSKSAFSEINKAYYYYMDEFKETAQRLRGYEKEANLDILGYAEKYSKLYDSPAYVRYEIHKLYEKDIRELQNDLKMAETPEERESIELDLYQIKAELIEELEATEKKKDKELKE